MTAPVTRLTAALADRYRIERELGQGGMATVYLAEDLKHKRQVAVKVLRPELAAVLGAERFVQEITTTASLQHPHILPLFDSGEADSFLVPSWTGRSSSVWRKPSRSPVMWPTPSTTPTATASSTATSSRRTSCCTTVAPWWPTSASPWR